MHLMQLIHCSSNNHNMYKQNLVYHRGKPLYVYTHKTNNLLYPRGNVLRVTKIEIHVVQVTWLLRYICRKTM